MIETYGRGDDGIGGGEDGYEVHAIEDHTIADGEPFPLADISDAGGGCEVVAAAAVVEHRETIIITFNENTDDGGDPAGEGDKGEDEDADDVHRLP